MYVLLLPLSLSLPYRVRPLSTSTGSPQPHTIKSIWIAITHELQWPKHQHQAGIKRSHIEILSQFVNHASPLTLSRSVSLPRKLRSKPRECVRYIKPFLSHDPAHAHHPPRTATASQLLSLVMFTNKNVRDINQHRRKSYLVLRFQKLKWLLKHHVPAPGSLILYCMIFNSMLRL